MLRRRLIPSLLLRDGKLVKGVNYTAHRPAGRPDTTVRVHDAQGADEIVVVDIDATRLGRMPDLKTLSSIADECSVPLTIGGGVDSFSTAGELMNIGADKLMLTATARRDPDVITQLAHRYGSQAVVVGVDAVETEYGYCLYDHVTGENDPSADPFTWAQEAVERGAGEIRIMAVSREGTRKGCDLELIRRMYETVTVPLIAEGGAGSLADLSSIYHAGADACAVGTLLVFADNNLVKVKDFLLEAGHKLRR